MIFETYEKLKFFYNRKLTTFTRLVFVWTKHFSHILTVIKLKFDFFVTQKLKLLIS